MLTHKLIAGAHQHRGAILLGFALVLWGRNVHAQQVEVTLQGGIHAARLDRPERILTRAGPVAMESAPGEATTVGLRVGRWLSNHWGVDAGVAWSRNHSWQGSTTLPPPSFSNETVFTTAMLRVRPTPRAAAISVSGGVGPALIFHRGNGTSLLTRQTDVGAVVGAAAEVRLSGRFGVRLDMQEYLFGSHFAQDYQPPLSTAPLEPAGTRFRHELVVLIGATLHIGR